MHKVPFLHYNTRTSLSLCNFIYTVYDIVCLKKNINLYILYISVFLCFTPKPKWPSCYSWVSSLYYNHKMHLLDFGTTHFSLLNCWTTCSVNFVFQEQQTDVIWSVWEMYTCFLLKCAKVFFCLSFFNTKKKKCWY